MTGLGAGDTGPTGDLQVLVDEPEPDSLPAQVGMKPSYCSNVPQVCTSIKHDSNKGNRKSLIVKDQILNLFLAGIVWTRV